jgi:hypothetical protein
MPDPVDNPRKRRKKLLLQSAAITTSALLVWCNRAGNGDDNIVYANPKGPTYDSVTDAAPEPEPTATAAQATPETSASAVQPAPSGQSAQVASTGTADAKAPDAGAPDAKAPSAKPTTPVAPKKPKIYANPKGSLYEIPQGVWGYSPACPGEPAAIDRERSSGRGSARG